MRRLVSWHSYRIPSLLLLPQSSCPICLSAWRSRYAAMKEQAAAMRRRRRRRARATVKARARERVPATGVVTLDPSWLDQSMRRVLVVANAVGGSLAAPSIDQQRQRRGGL